MTQSTTPRRRPRRTGLIRSLLGYLRPFQSERYTLRAAMTIDDWRTLASERGAAIVEARREADAMAIEVRTLRRAVSLADEQRRIAEAGMRHADGERDDAQRISAKWEIEAADLRDRLVEAERERDAARTDAGTGWKRADELAALLDSEREAWREERAGMVRERHDLANRVQAAEGRVGLLERRVAHALAAMRDKHYAGAVAILCIGDPNEPDPRAAGPGGADLLAGGDS